jgi:S-adenosylmethionine:tRNA ribosyltransferase-isomerase
MITVESGSGFETLMAQYDYALAPEAIAQQPSAPRDASRLLVLDRARKVREHAVFRELGRFLSPGDLLVVNDTRVVPARLLGRKHPGGGAAELMLVEPISERRFQALVRMSGRARTGGEIDLGGGDRVCLIRPIEGARWEVEFDGLGGLSALLERRGHVPLPPYIRRGDGPEDWTWYQTVYATRPGAVAAPTAGLHFTTALLDELATAGIARARVTLHVGPGTFQPLRPEALRRGELHEEAFELPDQTAAAVTHTRNAGGRVIAVGTTSARVLEACADGRGGVIAARGRTRLFIRPPYAPRVVDGLITNFHLPRTSLLMLVAAFAGRESVLEAYAEARERGYRFYSYGDAMLIR